MRSFHEARALALVLLVATPLAAQSPRTVTDSARHALNRLGYGATPGQVDAVERAGVAVWIERQLAAPLSDPALREREQAFTVLKASTRELVAMHTDQVRRAVRAQASGGDSAMRRQAMADQQGSGSGRRTLRELNTELAAITIVRAVHSDHQLGEVMADFWLNHFNVFVNKGFDRAYFRDHVERVVRAHALGSFGDLLLATAKSPAMLFYLDNVQSVADGANLMPERIRGATPDQRARGAGAGMPGRPGIGRMAPPDGVRDGRASAGRRGGDPAMAARVRERMPRGLNENYARELLELHTLGVDGGYTQQDVVAVARILTGWTIDRRNAAQGFTFNARAHDSGAKDALGVHFDAGDDVREGERLIALLANHPATMHHVSAKLCARFVADAAPDGCVDDAVRAWKKGNGNIREILRAIIASPDFWAPANDASKVKTPLEFVVSAVRAVGGATDDSPRLAQQVGRLGQPLFQQSAPTGYPESQQEWVNSGALLARMNFAVALAAGRIDGVTVTLDRVVALTNDHAALVAAIDRVVLHGTMGPRTRDAILRELADVQAPAEARALAVGLAIGGPEFQRQ